MVGIITMIRANMFTLKAPLDHRHPHMSILLDPKADTAAMAATAAKETAAA